MKKVFALMAAIMLLVSLAACGAEQTADSPSAPSPESPANPSSPSSPASTPSDEPESPSQPEAEPAELLVSAAASLTDVTKEIADAYKTVRPNVTLTFTYGSSGSLQTQIEEGAPADVFISAATKQMNALSEKGLLYGEGKDLLINKIVLVVPADSQAGITSFEDVGTDKVKSIAFGDPATTPAGQYGQEIFTHLGILDTANSKANLGSDVRQVLTWVEMGEVDCGIVFMTDALTTDDVTVAASAPDGSHAPAIYPVGIIESSKNKEEAQLLVDFLYSSEAKAIFEKNGFSMAG